MDTLFSSYTDTHQFTVQDVQNIHRVWLSPLFDWAGDYRTVDIVSDDIRWCHAQHIDSEMKKWGKNLKESTPFTPKMSESEMLQKITYLHGEFIMIHPFRDGNGRTIRLLMDLLLLQSGRKPTVHKLSNKSFREMYHKAIRQIWIRNDYSELEAILKGLLEA
jgi:cell filamentation protein